MDLFFLHCLLLIWLTLGAVRQLTLRIGDRLLAAALIGWGNIVTTGLLLSAVHQLGERAWFLGVSGLLAVLTFLGLRGLAPPSAAGEPERTGPNRWLVSAFVLTFALLAWACFRLAWTYAPGDADSLAYHLPRAMYYLGQGSLAHFDAADLRQTQLPFNYNLLQLVALIYEAPLQSLNFLGLCAWGVGGIAIHRLCRLCGIGANASLITCWLALVTTGVLAQSFATTPELAVGAALLCAAVFFLHWKRSRQTRDALLAALAVGLAAGSDLRAALLFIGGSLGWLLWTSRQPDARSILQTWRAPLLLAAGLALPFVAFNLAKGELGLAVLGRLADSPARDFWTGWWPLRPPEPGVPLNEDNAGFGLTALLFVLGAGYCVRRLRPAYGWLVWTALAWIAVVLLCHRLSLRPRDFTPALLLLSPCAACLIGAVSRLVGRLVLAAVALTALWSAGVYLLKNTSRPLEPLLNSSFVPPGLPSLPLLVEHRMTSQPRVNVDTDATDERIFPFMTHGHGQRFTSRHMLDPEAYNLLSRPTMGRNAAYSTLDQTPAYVMVPMETKRTAGVEFLATVGSGASARDYLGLAPRTGDTAPITSNRTLLVTVYREPGPQERIRIQLAGLNPGDQAHLAVELLHDDRTTTALVNIPTDGETMVAITRPFRLLVFRAVDTNTGAEIGRAVIGHLALAATNAKPRDPTMPSNARPLFVTDLVLPGDTSLIACDGLLPTEGPFPQWNIPYIRWAREPVVRLKIPPLKGLARLQLSFSFRLHVRNEGQVELFFNDTLVKHYALEGQMNWVDETLDLIPRAGTNVLEFRDATHKIAPDWADYLERYPDVKNYLLSANIPLESGAASHFETNGRAEGRTVKTRETPELEPAYESYYFMFRNLRLEGFKAP